MDDDDNDGSENNDGDDDQPWSTIHARLRKTAGICFLAMSELFGENHKKGQKKDAPDFGDSFCETVTFR